MGSSAGIDRRSLLQLGAGGLVVAAGVGGAADPAAMAQGGGRIKEYWIQVDSFHWNVVPNGKDNMMGMTFTPEQTSYHALGYRAYTPGWKKPLPGNDDIGPNTGVPGPIIRGQVGDTIKIHFRNNDTKWKFPYSMHPHGVEYGNDSDGAWMADDPDRPGTAIPPGGEYTYTWRCVPSSVGTWVYHDHSKPMPNLSLPPDGGHGEHGAHSSSEHRATMQAAAEKMPVMELAVMMGLYGFVVVTDAKTKPVDREFFLFLSEFWTTLMPVKTNMMGFNGYAFVDNTPTLTARVGQRVRWHIGTLGLLPHVFHVHGHRWHDGKRYVDSEAIEASETLVLEWVEDNPGKWLYHCHYADHMAMGMAGRYVVS